MAIVRYGPLVQAVSGRLGGVVFAKAGRGVVVRQCGYRVRRTSSYAQAARTNLGTVGKAWAALSAGEQEGWKAFGLSTQRRNRLGMADSYRGRNLFYRENLYRLAAGAPTFGTIPQHAEVGLGTLVGGLFVAGGPYSVQITAPAVDATGYYLFYGFRLHNRGGVCSFVPVVIGGYSTAGGPLYNLYADWVARLGDMVANELFWLGVRYLGGDSLSSPLLWGVLQVS